MKLKKGEGKIIGNALIMVFQFSINMIVPIFMCTLVGVWIGRRTGIDWISVPLFFVGAMAGFTNIYKMTKKLLEMDEKGDKNVKKTK